MTTAGLRVRESVRLLDLNAPHGSPDDERLDALAVAVEAYEDTHVPALATASPQAAVYSLLE